MKSAALTRRHPNGRSGRSGSAEVGGPVGTPAEFLHPDDAIPARQRVDLGVVHDPVLRAVRRDREAGVPRAVHGRRARKYRPALGPVTRIHRVSIQASELWLSLALVLMSGYHP